MMTNTQALRAILARVGTFTGMPKVNIQLANNPLVDGKPFEPPENEIWAKVTVKNGGSFIAEIGEQPNIRTTGIIFIQLFAPLNTGTDGLSQMADKWVEHLQFYKTGDLELREANILDAGHSSAIGDPSSMSYYQYNVNSAYVAN
ncbi:phage tail terminator-like protein [Acinetobacter sp. CWB-B33]|uniref:phage tail terminator-like protein n=1 Tax=Acinetobacter sp. CWB-B33 TaxID=2815724 RepID=UPI0031FE93DA